eukprot:948477-Pelagomonas_calceolata.AAC.1
MAMPCLLFAGLHTVAANASSALRNYFRGWFFIDDTGAGEMFINPPVGSGGTNQADTPGQPQTKSLPQADEHLHQPDLGGASIPSVCPEVNVGDFGTNGLRPRLLPDEEVQNIQQEFHDVFTPQSGCPPHQFDLSHTIRLQEGATPTYRRPYRLSPVEQREVEKQISEFLQKGLIGPCASPCGAPVLALNKFAVRDRFPLPRTDELLDSLHG